VVRPANCLFRFVGVGSEYVDLVRARLIERGVNSRLTNCSEGESGGVLISIDSEGEGGGESDIVMVRGKITAYSDTNFDLRYST
jgi:hypothetical protein